MAQLLNKEGDFSLIKHYESYTEIEKNLKSRKGVDINGSIDGWLFVIYTNADVEERLKSDKSTESGQEKFLNTGGSVLQFNEEKHKDIYDYMKEKPRYREFLSRYRIMYRQANEKEMDGHIIPPLQEKLKFPDSERESACQYFCDFVKDWWENDKNSYFLEEGNHIKYDPLQRTSEKVRTTLITKILDQRKKELDELSIKYKESAITAMKQLIEDHKALLIYAPGQSITLTAAKIHQMLSATEYIMLNLQQLVRYKSEVMRAWKGSFKVMVLEGDRSAEDFEDVFNEISMILKECGSKKTFIFISSRQGNIEQTSALHRKLTTHLTVKYDDWRFADLDTASQKFYLEKKVCFQGAEVKLSYILQGNNVDILNALDPKTMSLLLDNEKPSIGIPIEDTVDYYIDRTLQCRNDVNINSYRKENVEGETTRVWKPSILQESEGRVILVTDEPGMGKSTLLTHLAKETRERHPDMWIVRVNINNYTNILQEMKTNGSDEKGSIKLLTEAAQITETEGLQLEGQLFHYTYRSTGNMVVLIDGVDEVSPHYTEEVIHLLKILSKTEIKKIWITSRNSLKGQLEQELQCQSYSLLPFNEEDQRSFLVKFWKKTGLHVKQDYFENLAKRVVELSFKDLRFGDVHFMGVPLQSMLLAELFEENLKHFSTSATVELPEHINLVMLYDLYVSKKWDIYLSHKKVSDRTNVSVLTENAELYEHFIHNHTAAALVAILSTHHLEKLADKTITEKAEQFLQKIIKGVEKTGIITDVIEGRPVFQHRTLAEYFLARWLCKNIPDSQNFIRDHLFESGFDAVRNIMDRILADKCPLHEAVLNLNVGHVERLLRKNGSISGKDRGGRTPLHVAVSCNKSEHVRLLLEHGADVSSVDTLLGLSPVDYAIRMDDWEMLSLMMEKRPDIREHVLNGANHDCVETTVSALRAAAKYGRNDLLQYLISKGNYVNVALPGGNSTLLHEAARSQQTETVKVLVQLGASTDSHDGSGKSPLHVSVEAGSLELIKSIVESQETVQRETGVKCDANLERTTVKRKIVNVRDIDGSTPLHLAAAAGNTNIVSYLISAGSDLNARNVQGEYPLTLAARSGKNGVVELMLKGNSGITCEEAKMGALTAAIVADHVDTTALLLRLGAPVSGRENEQPVHTASRMGQREIVSLLLQCGASLSSRTDSGNTALHLASEAGHMGMVKDLVETEDDDLHSLNYESETPLHLAIRNGRERLVEYFVEKGCNINATYANGDTYLHVACENGCYRTVEYLLKHGAKVNAMNSANQTALHIAAGRGHTKIIEMLSLHNANFSLRDKDGITALLAASRNGHTDTVRFIVQHGGNIEDTDGKGNTIAHFAVANENHDILKFLSKLKVNLDAQNSDRETPLLQAVREGRNTIVHYLVEENCNINTQDNYGNRPLDVAVLNGNTELTRLLLERNGCSVKPGMHIVAAARFGFLDLLHRFVDMGNDFNMMTEDGECPLHVACKSGQVATVQYLCEHGALLDSQDNRGNTALHVAVSNGHLDVTRVLVGKGASMAVANASGSTALHIAAVYGHANIVRFLADSFSLIDMRNAKKQTALLVAADQGHEEIVRILIEQGAGLGVKDIEGKTALDIATEKGYVVITQLLKDRAEGKMLVSSMSHTKLQNAAENGKFEHLQRTVKGGASTDAATEKRITDTKEMFKTRDYDKLETYTNSRSELKSAAEQGKLEEVKQMVKAGIAIDYCDTFGRTALWGAASKGHTSVIRILLENGSCTNIPDFEGVTPIDIAAREDHWDAVDEFLIHAPTIRPECAENLKNQLHKASDSGNLEVVRTVLKCGVSVDTTNEYGYTPTHAAAKSGCKEIIRILLKNGANVSMTDNCGKTPLTLAAEYGFVETVRELLGAEANNDISSPLLSATVGGHVEVVRELLNHGASVGISNEVSSTLLNAAVQEGHLDVLRELQSHGTNIDIQNNNGLRPLHTAAEKGHVQIIRELLNHCANFDILDKDGRTPLNIAALNGHAEVVRALLDRGASVDIACEEDWTPLNSAALNGHVEVVRELLDRRANVEIATTTGLTPINTAALNGHVEVVRELLIHGASMDIASDDGKTPLYSAALNGHAEVVRELLNHSANVDTADEDGITPLNSAAANGHVEVVRELLNHGANVDVADEDGITPVNSAAANGYVEVIQELLNHGANVDIADEYGITPVNSAAANGHLQVVRELLNHGANVDIADKDGITPLKSAVAKGHEEIVRELRNHGANVAIEGENGTASLNSAAANCHLEFFESC